MPIKLERQVLTWILGQLHVSKLWHNYLNNIDPFCNLILYATKDELNLHKWMIPVVRAKDSQWNTALTLYLIRDLWILKCIHRSILLKLQFLLKHLSAHPLLVCFNHKIVVLKHKIAAK